LEKVKKKWQKNVVVVFENIENYLAILAVQLTGQTTKVFAYDWPVRMV
jgi:hypothetical protein